MRSSARTLNKHVEKINKNKNAITELFDDAIEEGDLVKFESELVPALLSSKIPDAMKIEILTDAMDTAYRGTKVIPQSRYGTSFVDYLNVHFNIPIPTYSFGPLTKK